MVPEFADRAVLIGCVVFVTDDLGDRGPGQGHRQHDDPGAPAGAAACETGVRGSSLGHRLFDASRDYRGRQAGSLTPDRLSFLNRRMVSPKRTAAWAVALLFLLAMSGIVLHEHDVQDADHADCDACHLRHVPGVESDGAPVSSAADLVHRAAVSASTDGERGAALGIRPTRGPPA